MLVVWLSGHLRNDMTRPVQIVRGVSFVDVVNESGLMDCGRLCRHLLFLVSSKHLTQTNLFDKFFDCTFLFLFFLFDFLFNDVFDNSVLCGLISDSRFGDCIFDGSLFSRFVSSCGGSFFDNILGFL